MATEGIASKVITTLGNGSGIDFTQLARDLADVEKAPREARITAATEAAEAKISAFAVLKYNVQLLVDQFNALNDASELATPVATSSDATKISIAATNGAALQGISDISVTTLAAAQRNKSNQYSSSTQSLNSGSSFTLTITPGTGSATNITVGAGNDTPIGIVAAINAANAGVNAALLAEDSSGSNYRIVLTGDTGAANTFVVGSTLADSDLGFHDSGNGNNVDNGGIASLQNPADATLTYNGIAISRSSNSLNDVIPGVTLSLNAAHSAGASTSINVVSDKETLKTKLQGLVKVYNDLQFALDEISDAESEEDEVGGALARDLSAIRTVRDAVYTAVTQNSSTTSGNVTGMRDIGVTLMRDGNLKFDEATFNAIAATNFDDISVMISAGTTNQSRYDGQSQGLAMDAIIELETLTDSIDGIFVTRTATAQKQITGYEKDLADLETRIEQIYERYLDQFVAMETLVSSINSTRESMTTTWENMSKMYNK
jgi:flagellar hook-associated protein 2